MRVFAITMQRNEAHCLEPWIKHHGHLFGFENICVLDHASSSPRTRALLSDYAASGVRIVSLPSDTKFDDKGRLIFEQFESMQAAQKADFIFPIDCDELLFLKNDADTLTASRDEIVRYLTQFRGFTGRLFIRQSYLRIFGHSGHFWPLPYQKVFFDADACVGLDHGFHFGYPREEGRSVDTNFIYAHFHFKPYEINRQLSIEKLQQYVDVSDVNALVSYNGPGFHLIPQILVTREEYYGWFKINDDVVYRPDIDHHLSAIGIDPCFSDLED